MTRVDRHLLVLLGLIAVTAILVSLPRDHARAATGLELASIPGEIGMWRERGESAEEFLPPDARSLESLSRIYHNGQRRVWVSVARYAGDNGPQQRPALGALVRTAGVTSTVRDVVIIPLGGGRSLETMRLSVGLSGRTITTWYWYQLGPRTIGGEYSLRFWLGLNTVLRRQYPLFLVRIATTGRDVPVDFIESLLPQLEKLVFVAGRN